MNSLAQTPRQIKIILSLLTVLSIVLLCIVGFLFNKIYREHDMIAATVTAQVTAQQIVADVGKVLLLPANEVPTIATVTDPSQLKSQPFFAEALTGDKVLIYQISHKAILWRPSETKVIAISGFSSASSTATSSIGVKP